MDSSYGHALIALAVTRSFQPIIKFFTNIVTVDIAPLAYSVSAIY
jgi:hypothetical protein